MADLSNNWGRMVNLKLVDPNEKLFLFGYSCKVFRDDEKAVYIDQGKHLIPWMGDETLMIDRYDVRGYLHDLKQYEPNVSGIYEDPLSEEETLCDEERYRSLRTDMSEEQLYQEEELKRLRAAIASDGAYHEIAFTYDTTESEKYEQPEASKVEEPEDELYQVPAGLKVPKGMEVPYNMKIHTIIEKTAHFVSEQGGQMEIIIKMKQHANPQFGFMHLDNPLYPYYKHLVKEIKSGSYKPAQVKKISQSEEDDDDEHYLHPSLMSGRAEDVPKFTVPSINFRRNHDDSYSVLVRNLRQHLVEETPVETPSSNKETSHKAHAKNRLTAICSDESSCDEHQNNVAEAVMHIPPPPDLQPIIHKMAEYVAKNGEDFEIIVKSKNDDRFAFLHPWNEYYEYYIQKRNEAKQQISETSRESEQHSAQPILSDSPKSASNDPVQDSCADTVSPTDVKEESQTIFNCENEIMELQDLQETTFGPDPLPQEMPKEDQTDSMESLDSQSSIQSAQEDMKSKSSKSVKAPISFSLKMKDSETPTSDKSKMSTLLLDDSEEDDDETKTDKTLSDKRRKSVEDSRSASNSRHDSVEKDEKSIKQNNESLEAKQAEDRIKDKLLATARERIAQQKKEKQMQLEQQKREEQLKKDKQAQVEQQRKEKQLQLERKRKAAIFLKMLEKKNPDSNVTNPQKSGAEKKEVGLKNSKKTISAGLDSDFWVLPDAAGASDNGIVFPSDKMYIPSGQNFPLTVQGLKHAWATNSFSGESGEEEPITEYGEKHSSDSEPVPAKVVVVAKPERKKKKKKRSHSKSRERSRSARSKSSRRSRERHRSRSPVKNHKEKSKREKELPAAYSFKRSRSRSRSPRRYRPGPSHWNRRR